MCLIPLKTKKFLWWIFPKVQIARKDIIVYKVLTSDHRAPFQPYYIYSKGYNCPDEIDTESRRIQKNPECKIGTGWLHACVTESCANDMAKSFNSVRSYLKFNVYKMIIPKRTKYILGIDDEVCAKCLKFNPEE